jgi:hypothetical protein
MASGKQQFRVGDTVMHKKLGKGDILDVYPLGEDICAVISFEKWGQKKIILKFANLELISRAKAEPETKEEKKDKHPVEEVDEAAEVEVDVDEEVEGAEAEEGEEEEGEEEHKGDES